MHSETDEISYAILSVAQDLDKTNQVNSSNNVLATLSTAINVRLLTELDQYFPFVQFDKFNNALKEDKVFLFGPSGSGKSRAIYEMLKKNIVGVEKIYVINPRNNLGQGTRKISVHDLVNIVGNLDVVVWDNFPDNLLRRDIVNAQRILEILSSATAKKLLVTLKPKYLEAFREITCQIPEFFTIEIEYAKEQFKQILQQYGTFILQFKETYTRYVSKDIEQISDKLWKKEPTPLTILDYYNELVRKHQTNQPDLDGATEAEKLLRSSYYYQHQFEILRNSDERAPDTDFLYIIKMCYELGLNRTEATVFPLQHAIFKTNTPNRVYNRLSNWIYLYGQNFSMHDVSRDAVNFSDGAKIKILSFISSSFASVVTNESHQANLLGLFIGRNIQFVLQKKPHFLPDSIYEYMKKNPDFERAIGQGVGEVYLSLEESDRVMLLQKADVELEFGRGVAEILGQKFAALDYRQRKPILDKIYDVFLFARFFGQNLGAYFAELPPEVKHEILDHASINPQFADGLGIGLGKILDSLDEDLRKELNAKAEANIGLTRGLGFGLSFNFATLSEIQRTKIYQTTESNFQLDMGLGIGLANQYIDLPKILQDEVLARCKDHFAFGFGFGLYLGYLSAHNVPNEVIENIDRTSQLAYGLGYGFGLKYPYERSEFQASIVSKCSENNQLDRGLGYGLGIICKHLPKTLQDIFFRQGDQRNEFDRGLGCGIGFAWRYQKSEYKDRFYERCKTNTSFAQGVGFGQGYHFTYLPRNEIETIFKNAGKNAIYDAGVGYGLGWSFPYLGNELRNEIVIRSKMNPLFAFGLASGLGVILTYLPLESQTDIFIMAAEDGWFSRGLGFGLGCHALQSLNEEQQAKFLSKISEDTEFSIGLGEGIGFGFKFFQDEFRRKMLDNTVMTNSFFTRGLGIGFGKSLKYLSPDFQVDLYKRAEENPHFALGLGEGIASIFQYLDESVKNEILMRAFSRENGFAKGVGIGLGTGFPYLSEEFRDELLLQRSATNKQLAIGLGKGLGATFAYHSPALQQSLLNRTDDNSHFAMGLGEGIGSIIFRSFDDPLREDVFSKAEKNSYFAKGLGVGIGCTYGYNSPIHELHQNLFKDILRNDSMAEGFGTGIGIVYPYLSALVQGDVSLLAKQNISLATGFGFGLGHTFDSRKSEEVIKSLHENRLPKLAAFEYGFGVGIGHNFSYLKAEIQEMALSMVHNTKDFGSGLGTGLARSFGGLDGILQQEILRIASIEERSEIWRNLGYGLGSILPSIIGPLRQQLLQIANDYNNSFTKGFVAGLNKSIGYLDKESTISREEDENKMRMSSIQNNHMKNQEEFQSPQVDFPFDFFISSDGINNDSQHHASNPWASGKEEVSFLGKRKMCCVCFIDIVGSTKTASQLDKTQVSKYYAVFLNAMATIIRNFDGKIVKNAGDALIYYFPNTTDAHDNPSSLRDVVECGITMIAAHQAINAKMQEEGLPPINYRISAEYGAVEVARSQSSQSEDLFGSTMNVCAKINGKAKTNGIVIGEELFKMVQSMNQYVFESAGMIDLGLANKNGYLVYHVESKERRSIVNPFKYKKQA